MKHFPISLVAFSWILVGRMVLYRSKFIFLLSSYIKSSVKLRGPVPETAMYAHPMIPPPPCFTDEAVCLGSFLVPFFLQIFAFPSLRSRFFFVSSVHKHSSKTLLARLCAFLQTLIYPFYFWCWSEVCILLCSICNSVSKSPEDSRLSEHHPSFLEVVGDFTDTYFRVHFHSFYDLSVINYCCFLSRSGICWLLVSLVVSKLLIYPCPLFSHLHPGLSVSSSNARFRMQK